jgi:ACR3 family arsenite efflux pump ArsB
MRRFNLKFRQYILLWALLAMVIGYLVGRFNHQKALSLQPLITPLLFLMIFLILFPTDLSSLLHLGAYRNELIVSFFLSVLAPVISIAVSRIIPARFQFLRTGIVISSTVPPNAMLSAWTVFLEGDVLLTLIIQSFTFIYYLFLVPFGLEALLRNNADFSFVILVKNLLILIVVPFLLAGGLRQVFRRYLGALKRIKPTLSTVAGMIELFILLISIALRADVIADNPVLIMWGVFTAALLYIILYGVALLATILLKLSRSTSIALVFQNGSKNLPIAMVIALSTFESQAMLGVAACVLAQFPISALFFTLYMKSSKRQSPLEKG